MEVWCKNQNAWGRASEVTMELNTLRWPQFHHPLEHPEGADAFNLLPPLGCTNADLPNFLKGGLTSPIMPLCTSQFQNVLPSEYVISRNIMTPLTTLILGDKGYVSSFVKDRASSCSVGTVRNIAIPYPHPMCKLHGEGKEQRGPPLLFTTTRGPPLNMTGSFYDWRCSILPKY